MARSAVVSAIFSGSVTKRIVLRAKQCAENSERYSN